MNWNTYIFEKDCICNFGLLKILLIINNFVNKLPNVMSNDTHMTTGSSQHTVVDDVDRNGVINAYIQPMIHPKIIHHNSWLLDAFTVGCDRTNGSQTVTAQQEYKWWWDYFVICLSQTMSHYQRELCWTARWQQPMLTLCFSNWHYSLRPFSVADRSVYSKCHQSI